MDTAILTLLLVIHKHRHESKSALQNKVPQKTEKKWTEQVKDIGQQKINRSKKRITCNRNTTNKAGSTQKIRDTYLCSKIINKRKVRINARKAN